MQQGGCATDGNQAMLCLPKTMCPWNRALLLLLVLAWCCSGQSQAQPDIELMLVSEPSRARTLMDEWKPENAATTCRLIIEGGSNKTEMKLYGTSIAKAQLACNGTVMRIAVHPVLAPFARHFTGVNVTSIPQMQDLERAEKDATDECYSRSNAILYLCGQPEVAFLQPHVVNLVSVPIKPVNESSGNKLFWRVVEIDLAGVVSLVDPFLSQLQFCVLQLLGALLYVKGGVINTTMGVQGAGVMLYDGTRFTDNESVLYGGAVTIVTGHAVFRDCVFTGNQAKSLNDSEHHTVPFIDSLVSGFGGAVSGRGIPLGNGTVRVQTSATFVNCTFTDNKALQGGAIAMLGVNTSITNCTFNGNSATQGGFDVFSAQGGTLDITRSNITVASLTVAWERADVNQCLRGESFDMLQGTCRRCPASTYALVTPAPASCSVCPMNAKCAGGDAIVATYGFFRVSNASDKVISCPRAGACLEGTCADGHQGMVCGSCREGYAPSAPFKCVECKSKAGALAVFVASTLVLVVFTAIAIQLTLVANKEESSDPATHPTAGDVVKLLALFLQYTSIIGSLPVPWPRSLLALITASDWVFASSVDHTLAWVKSPLECALMGLRVPSAVLKQLVSLLMPAFVALVQLLFFVSIYACCCPSKQHTLRLTVVLLTTGFFTFPIVLRAAFSFFGCFSVYDPTLAHSLWWVQAMSQPCYLGAHRVWSFAVGLPFLIACCSAPLVLSLWLWRNSARMGEPEFRERYGHLYRLYRAHAYWYEPVVLIQTILLVALAVFASQIGNHTAVVLTGLHIAMALQLLQLVRPYAASLLHRLHVASLCCLLLNVFVALLMFDQPVGANREVAFGVGQAAAAAFSLIMSACYIIASCAFICIYYISGHGKAQVRNLLARWCVKASDRAHGCRRRG